MRTIYSPFFALLLVIGFGSCNIINPSEVVPTYVQIDSFTFSGRQLGTTSHKITNVWVYLNNAPVGNFDLPAKFPVIISEPGTLTVAPAIDYYGLVGFPFIYTAYTSDAMTLTPNPGGVVPFAPNTGYNANAKLQYDERFDAGAGTNNTFAKMSGYDTMINTTTPPGKVFEGGGSGIITLTPGKDSAFYLTGPTSVIERDRDAYIELNYKTNMTLRVGMYSVLKNGGEVYTQQLIGLKANNDWNKVYIGIKEFIQGHEGTEYRVLIRADKPTGSSGEALIDNLKVVSF